VLYLAPEPLPQFFPSCMTKNCSNVRDQPSWMQERVSIEAVRYEEGRHYPSLTPGLPVATARTPSS
jgi:hypothetical protein